MPAANPMAEVIAFGGDVSGSAGPVAARAGGNVAVDDHHVSAALLVGAIVVAWALWASKFRFSMTVGGG
jgi:hypothetical protein